MVKRSELREMIARAEANPQDVLKEHECAELLRMTTRSLVRRRQRDAGGAPPHIQIGEDGSGKIRYLRSSVIEWLKAHESALELPPRPDIASKLERAKAAACEAFDGAIEELGA